MNLKGVLHKNIRYFARYYRLVVTAVLIAVAVIVGSLIVGDSVRMTLVKRVNDRLGNTETILFARNSYMSDSLLTVLNIPARGILLTDGFVSRNGKQIPVYVWGVDDLGLRSGVSKINPALSKELELAEGEDIVLRLPAAGMVPSGSLFVTDNYTTSLRLSCAGELSAEEGGNLSLRSEQILPFNIFVNREDLTDILELGAVVNLILLDRPFSAADLEQVWKPALSGLQVKEKEDYIEISSNRVFLQEQVIETLANGDKTTNRLFSYLANGINRQDISIPYSFITAIDRYKEYELQEDEILLSDYSAKRLKAKVGDEIAVTYFKSKGLKQLTEDTIQLKVKAIIPITEWVADGSLSANFPGLSDVDRCTDWDSDLPIDMELITDEDEEYWNKYKSTPKALIAYSAVTDDWSNAYGNATALRLVHPNIEALTFSMFGLQLIYPREAGIYSATNGVDFAGLFLALGFFIIVSAILLMLNPLSEMFYQRRNEIALFRALGFSQKRLRTILWQESVPVVLIGVGLGVVAGFLYTALIMWLLGNVWQGATQTDGFLVSPNLPTLLIGILVSLLLSFGLLYDSIRRALREKLAKQDTTTISLARKRVTMLLAVALTLLLIGVNLFLLRSVPLFMVIGAVWILTAAVIGDYWLAKYGKATSQWIDRTRLVWSSLFANRQQAMLSFFALAMGVFIVFAVGLNRKGFADSSQIRTGTGGYSLWCESSVPVYYDLSTPEGRAKLSLSDLPQTTTALPCLRYQADDASCLNLNKVTTPTVLGVDMDALIATDFQLAETLYEEDREQTFRRMREKEQEVYPALVDATVLTWGIGVSLGDTLHYESDYGEPIAIRLIGTLANSIFQGNLLVDRSLFGEMWQETTGSEVFLLKTEDADRDPVKNLLSQALNEYGVRVTTTNDRLKAFNEVTDTYLTIFMTLGGLGLLIGIMSFIIVIRKNLAMREKEIKLYRMLGYPHPIVESILYKENVIVPLYAIGVGVIGALLSIGLNFPNAGWAAWTMAILFTGFFMGCVHLFVRRLVKQEVERNEINKESK